MNSPDRVYLSEIGADMCSIDESYDGSDLVEYVRADIADQMLAALRESLRELDHAYSGAPHFATIAKGNARAAIAAAEMF